MVIGKKERRRKRKTPKTLEKMIFSLYPYFVLHNIQRIILILRIRPHKSILNLGKALKKKIYL